MREEEACNAMRMIIQGTLKTLENKKRWVNGGWCRDSNGRIIGAVEKGTVKFSVAGAVGFNSHKLGYPNDFYYSALGVVERSLPSIGRDWNSRELIYPTLSSFEGWATHDQVMAALQYALGRTVGLECKHWIPLDYQDLHVKRERSK